MYNLNKKFLKKTAPFIILGTILVTIIFAYTQVVGPDGITGFQWINATNLNIANTVIFDSTDITDIVEHPYTTTSYIVWENGGTYYAKNGTTGIVTSNANFATLFNSLIATGDVLDIFIREGNYTVTSQILIFDKYVYIHGVGVGTQYQAKGTRLIKGFNGTLLKFNYTNSDYSGFKVENLEIDGVRATYTGRGVEIHNAKGFSMRDVIIKQCKSNALFVKDSGWHRLYNVFTADCEADIIYYDSCNDWQWFGVEADTVWTADEDAVYLDDSKGEIIGGHFEAGVTYGRAGIYINDWVTVTGARIGLCGTTGIWLYKGDYSKIIGNRFWDINTRNNTEGHAIRVVDTDYAAIIGNTFENRSAVSTAYMRRCVRFLTGSANNIIIGNVFDGFTSPAVSDPTGNYIQNNIGYYPESVLWFNPSDDYYDLDLDSNGFLNYIKVVEGIDLFNVSKQGSLYVRQNVTSPKINATESITINGVTRTTWPSALGLADQGLNSTDDVVFNTVNITTKSEFGTQLNVSEEINVNFEWSGDAVILHAGEALSAGDFIYINDTSFMLKADADSNLTTPCVGVCLENIAENAYGLVLMRGWIYDSSWTLAEGDEVFVSTTAGDITITPPSGAGDQIQVVGIGFTEDLLYFNPDYTLLEVL